MDNGNNQHIKKAFESQNESAPDFMWKNISSGLSNNKTDEHIKSSFESELDSPPAEVWENVQDKIDINNTWKKITKHLDRKRFGWWIRLGKIAAVLLLFMVPYKLGLFSPEKINTASKSNNEFVTKALEEKTFSSEDNNTINFDHLDATKVIVPSITKSFSETVNMDGKLTLKVENVNGKDYQNNLSELYPHSLITIEPLKMSWLLNRKILNPISIQDEEHVDCTIDHSYNNFEIGVVGSVSNTWVINNETKEGFDQNSLIENRLSFGSSIGVYSSIPISEKSSLEPMFYFRNSITQSSYQYYEANYSTKTIKLSGFKLGLAYRRIFNVNNPQYYYLSFGGFADYFTERTISIDNTIRDRNKTFKNFDLGLKAELGKKIEFVGHPFQLGINVELGLNNLTSNQARVPRSLNRSRSLIGGAYIRIPLIN